MTTTGSLLRGSLMPRSARPLFALLGWLIAAAGVPQAQPPGSRPASTEGSIAGTVSDSDGVGIVGATVSVSSASRAGITNAEGAFRVVGVSAGAQTIIARRIGFKPETLTVEIPTAGVDDLRIQLRSSAFHVAPVIIEAGRARYTGRLRGFYERRDRGIGRFFTADDIDRRSPRVVTDLLRTLPGVRINNQNGQNVVTFRGMRCTPLVWVDGAPATAGYFDPDLLDVRSLAAIEVYPGLSTVPAELTWVRGKSNCGVIAVWTRIGTAVARSGPGVPAEVLAELVASLKLYTADQVDTPVAPDTLHPVSPAYPDSLSNASVGGRVVVEFVVDINGRPDMGTFGVVLTTNTLFTEVVRQAVNVARFTPAWLGGRRVRQLVQLPFAFEPTAPPTP